VRASLGAPDPGEFERRQPHNLFNDRRIGGKSKNRAYGESQHVPKNLQETKKNRQYLRDQQYQQPRKPKQFD